MLSYEIVVSTGYSLNLHTTVCEELLRLMNSFVTSARGHLGYRLDGCHGTMVVDIVSYDLVLEWGDTFLDFLCWRSCEINVGYLLDDII